MSKDGEPQFSSHDEPTAPSEKPTYALPPREWDEMVSMANHLAQREAEMPLRRRLASYEKELAVTEEAQRTYDWRRDFQLIGCFTAAALLVWAAAVDHEAGFFTFLRIYVTMTAAALAWHSWKEKRPIPLVAAAILAILFNPLLPIELEREDWIPIDALVAVGLAWVALEGPSKHLGRPLLRLAPLAIAGVIWAAVDLELFVSDDDDTTMNVDETMNAENVVSGDAEAWLNDGPSGVLSERPTLEAPRVAVPTAKDIQPTPDLDGIFSAPPADAGETSEPEDLSNLDDPSEPLQSNQDQSQE